MERRFIEQAKARTEVRVAGDDAPKQIVGYASVFYDGTPDTEYELWPGLIERIMPGAFDRAIKEQHDVRALFNHNPDNLLGRTSADTLTLSVDKVGLRYVNTPGATRVAGDVVAMIERSDLQGSSFAFMVKEEVWRTVEDVDYREIVDVDPLFDVGPVTYPAYDATTTDTRAVDVQDVWKQHQERLEDRKYAAATILQRKRRAADVRMQMLGLTTPQ